MVGLDWNLDSLAYQLFNCITLHSLSVTSVLVYKMGSVVGPTLYSYWGFIERLHEKPLDQRQAHSECSTVSVCWFCGSVLSWLSVCLQPLLTPLQSFFLSPCEQGLLNFDLHFFPQPCHSVIIICDKPWVRTSNQYSTKAWALHRSRQIFAAAD